MSSPIVSLKDVRQRHGDREVLHIDELDIPSRSIIGLAGPNGSGKSTLLRLLAFLDEPAEGTVRFHAPDNADSHLDIHRQVTLLVQEPYLLKRTVFANVAYGLKVRKERDIESKVREAMAQVGLNFEEFAHRHWYELSGGEAQRVAVASRLVLRPRLLLLDEPTASLDAASAMLIQSAVLQARTKDCTLVIASHDLDWLSSVSDDILQLEHGKIIRSTHCRPPEDS